jgi:hypothetical protein
MFKLPHQEWLEQQPKHTQEWLKKQAVWHDSDMFKAFSLGVLFGIIIGVVLCLQ